jgi:DNA-binding response OmpR family regulator
VLYINQRRKKPISQNPNWIALGKYHFDTLNAELILEEQRIELTSKESELLLLLYKTVNTTVEKEVLLNKVWGDEGDYIGRTLDVFISKLRKKLEFDPRIKIVNIRGVGYKLVMDI